MKNSRISFMDITRAFAIFLIVFGHVIVHNVNSYPLFKFIYSFHVILFFIISGYLYKSNQNTIKYILKKFCTLILPYFIFSFLFLIPYFIYGNSVNSALNSNVNFNIGTLIREIFFGVGYNDALKQNTALWFLPALFITEVLFKLLDNKYFNRINQYVGLFFLFIVSYYFTKVSIVFPFGLNTALVILPFYYIGTMLRKNSIIEKITNNRKAVFCFCVLVIIGIFVSQINDTVSCVNYRYGNYLYFLFTSIIFSIGVCLISYKINSNKLLEYIGVNTLSILIFHKLFILFFQTKIYFTSVVLINGNIYSCLFFAFIISCISISLSIFVGYIIKKYFPWLYGKNINFQLIIIKIIRNFIRFLIYIKGLINRNFKNNVDLRINMERIYYVEHDLYNFKKFKIKKEKLDLSIIIPVYNAEKYLDKCLDSILNQDTKYKYEVICINDGSSDNSLSILNEYKSKYSNIKVISQENKGISVTRNVGIENASGKYLGFIDNDDYVNKDYIERLLSIAYKEKADIVKCNFVNFTDNKILNVVRHDSVVIDGYMKEKILEFKGFVWGGVFNRDLFKEVRFPVGYWYEDMITRIILMRLCKKFVYIDDDLYYYNNHFTNASKTLWKSSSVKRLDQYFLVKKLLEKSDELGIEDNGEVYLILLKELGHILWLRTRTMDRKVRKQVFYLSCELINNYKSLDKYISTFEDKKIKQSFDNYDYLLWYLTSLYMMLEIKYFGGVKK